MPHRFKVHNFLGPSFCDMCGQMMHGIFRQGAKCTGQWNITLDHCTLSTQYNIYTFVSRDTTLLMFTHITYSFMHVYTVYMYLLHSLVPSPSSSSFFSPCVCVRVFVCVCVCVCVFSVWCELSHTLPEEHATAVWSQREDASGGSQECRRTQEKSQTGTYVPFVTV